ncbi:MAG: beta-lactamase family protein [Ruminococcus sp.]|nr:beta-lactamase family protein [Ruminococcus sp.]
MKNLFAIILSCVLVLCVTACSGGDTKSTEATQTESVTVTDEMKAKMDGELKKIDFEGIICITHNGEVVYESVSGEDEKGNALTLDSPMYIGSVSKQFCATAIMMLKEQGKLSVDDTLEKYFPEFEYGKDVTIKNLLTMRSGIVEFSFADEVTDESSEEEIFDSMKKYVFSCELTFEPDSKHEYVNTNFILLSDIVEQVSGKSYNDFIRENVFTPLEMTNSGFASEVEDSPYYSKHLTWDTLHDGRVEAVVARGAGDIVTTAPDMEKWMTGLCGGKLISKESYEEMTANYSPDNNYEYGYALQGAYGSGVSHAGRIGTYTAFDYINAEKGFNLFAVTNKVNTKIVNLPFAMLGDLMK